MKYTMIESCLNKIHNKSNENRSRAFVLTEVILTLLLFISFVANLTITVKLEIFCMFVNVQCYMCTSF